MRFAMTATVALALLASGFATAHADDLFTVTVTSNGQTATAGFNSASDAINAFKNGELNTLLPSYTSTSIASGTVNYRGLTATVNYPTSGTTLQLVIPSIGLNETFTGATRDASQKDLGNYLKTNNAYGQVEHALVAVSSVDPVAGNPSSLQSQMTSQAFSAAFETTPMLAGMQPNGVGVGLEYGHFNESGSSVNSYTIPLGYAFNVGPDNRYRLAIDLPLTYLNTQNAQSGQGSLAIGLTVPVTSFWSLTPRLAAGAVGSLDLGSAAALGSGSVTSALQFSPDGYGVVLGNMVGYSHSIKLSFGSYSVDPNVEDVFVKNGVQVVVPTEKLGFEVPWLPAADLRAFIADTRYVGTKLYENSMEEVGLSFGASQLRTTGLDLRVGASYVFGPHSTGVIADLALEF